MKNKITFLLIAAILSLPIFVNSQEIEKISFDPNDKTDGYYLAIQPLSKKIKGTLVLLTSFTPPEGLLTETKLHNVASANDILTIVTSAKQKLYADGPSADRITTILKDISKRFSADNSKFALAGYDEAGNIALRYTELTYETPSAYAVQPKAVFGIDTAVDLFGIWHWSERQIKKNYWQGAVGDAKYYLEAMTKDNGTIYDSPDKYKQLTPFNRSEESIGNEKYLQQVPVRLYYDTDIEWHLKNRRNSFYDTKMADGSELISRLLLSGNTKAEFITAKRPGLRSDGIRHPNSISIVDEVECIQWLKKSLDIFDANTWMAPYNLIIPQDWTTEHFSLPPEFAPQVIYKGVEDIRFAPGWADTKSDEHWTYCFLWWLENKPKIDAAGLQSGLKAYYEGLVSRNVPADKLIPTKTSIKKINTLPGDVETFNGTINMLDYHTQQAMTLNCTIHVKECADPKHTAVYFEISPKTFAHVVWKKMGQVGEKFDCSK